MAAVDQKALDWQKTMQMKIREAFDLFDKDKSDAVVQEEVGTMMRYLGVYPTERALVLEVLPSMQNDEPTGFVNYARFEKKMLEIISTKQFEPDPSDIMLQAFKTLDAENKGYLTTETVESLLTTKGTGFRPKELESFLLIARDPETGNVYYEDYISLLTSGAASAPPRQRKK